MVEELTLYTAKVCPFAHRVEIALAESGIPFSRFEIDLQNKPEWYAPRVNPASKVPAIAYGGPKADPSNPSPESTKIAESLVLVEFIADLASSNDKFHPLLPSDPIARAKTRFFIDAVSNSYFPAFAAVMRGQEDHAKVFEGVERIQALLPKEGEGKYAIGNEFTIADIAIAPFIARMEVGLGVQADLGDETSKNTLKVLAEDEKYARFRKYFDDLKERESFKKTWDEVHVKEKAAIRYRAQRSA